MPEERLAVVVDGDVFPETAHHAFRGFFGFESGLANAVGFFMARRSFAASSNVMRG